MTQATQTIVRRVREREEEVVSLVVERLRSEIVDYRTVDDEFLYGAVASITRHNLRVLLDNLERGTTLQRGDLELTREGAGQRVHDGISLASVQQAYRLGGEEFWRAIRQAAGDDPAEREAAMSAAGQVMHQIMTVMEVGSQAYLDEVEGVWSDREVLRRDLLEAVLAGRGEAETTRRDARVLGIRLRDDYAVVVCRRSDIFDADGSRRSATRADLRHAAEIARTHLRTPAGPALVGLREREIVALCPAAGHDERETVKAAAAALAAALAEDLFAVGMGGRHPTPAGVPEGYAEAREAATIAARTGARGTVVAFDEVIVDHILSSNPRAARIVSNAIAPLREYDARRNAALVETLRVYIDSHFNLARSGERLCIHPNTVIYRLDRIKTLTGRDPRQSDDLLLLALGLKLETDVA